MMKTIRKPHLFILCFVLFGSSGCAAESTGDEQGSASVELKPSPTTAEEDFTLVVDSTPIDRENPKYLTSYAPVLRPAKEAVVAVHSASVMRVIRQRGMDPREEILRRLFGMPAVPSGQPEVEERKYPEGVGSGVLISAEGYIVTNSHVITGRTGAPADEILVELNDGREFSAVLVGRDPRSDLAVLKIEAEQLPYLKIADSDLLEVGDIVFAIGNPMGIGLTITQGIVSATGRNNLSILGEAGYESFIQTDAPINPGNSGGALVDAYGRLIGINTAILSRSGGSIGLGFAIPTSLAHSIIIDLVHEGEVRRGILGVSIEDLNPEFAEAFEVPEESGAFIQSVGQGLPAEIAGMRGGDVIVSINEERVISAADLRLKVAKYAPGETIEVGIRRGGELLKFRVALADPENPFGEGAQSGLLLRGVEVSVIGEEQRRRFGIDRSLEGLVVTSVESDSPYAEGLVEGMVILEINNVPPRSLKHARSLLEKRGASLFFVYAEGRSGFVSIRVD